jgi:hypothetical protein
MKQTPKEPKSALDHYEHLSGWESKDIDETQHILQHLRSNLHPSPDHHPKAHKEFLSHKNMKQKRCENKENEVRLPSIHFPTQPLIKKGSFLALKHRNILKEAIENAQQATRPQLIIHEASHKLRLKPIEHSKPKEQAD